MSPKFARARNTSVEVISGTNPLITILLGSAVIAAAVKLFGGYVLKRTPAALVTADWQALVTQLREDVIRLRAHVEKLEASNLGMFDKAEEREAEWSARLAALKEANRIKLEDVYKELNGTRIRLEAVEEENKYLREQLALLQEAPQ